jgi:hypothetical protein
MHSQELVASAMAIRKTEDRTNLEAAHMISLRPIHKATLRDKIECLYTVEPGYNDIDLYDTALIESDILWYKLIRHC